ncbi:MAG TPA: cation:proton antiporter [Sedimentisphaerales bacterium]|nr:cation:proton antiporter [Sedimentisphaerales bacterium]
MSEIPVAISVGVKGLNVVLLIGIAVFCGTVGARVFQRLRIPQIIGYVTIGIILGPVLRVISQQTIETFQPFNMFALGIIGFLIGGELKAETFVKFGRQVAWILLFEGLAAFLLVGTSTFLVMRFFADWQTALAVGVLFGAICSATDPASTIGVLWEYRTRGPVTTLLTAIVALDDALALTLYAIGISVAGVITGHQTGGLPAALLSALLEIGGSLAMGVAGGFVLNRLLRRVDEADKLLVFTLSWVMLIIGTAVALGLDVIIASMSLGMTVTNIKSRRTRSSFDFVRRFSPPVYVLFFVLVGARLSFANVNTMIWLLVAAYVTGSIVGKTAGSYVGAAYSKAAKTVRNYLGFCLYPQGSVAIGLLIMASGKFESDISSIMLLVVIVGAFILQIVGPLGVKFGTKKAGEVGLNITEEDLIKTYTVGDVMDTKVPVIAAGMSLRQVIELVSNTDSFYYSVVDNDNRLIGAITLDGIRNTFATQEINDWLVALDIAEPIISRVTPDMPLSDAFEKTRQLHVEHLPVAVSGADDRYAGVLNTPGIYRRLSTEVFARQHKADIMADE